MTSKEQVSSKFGELLYNARTAKGWSQTMVADFVQVNRASISEWERGRRDLPLTKMIDICNILGVNPKEVFSEQV